MSDVPEALVERAAKAAWNSDPDLNHFWDAAGPVSQASWRQMQRAALNAVVPELLAKIEGLQQEAELACVVRQSQESRIAKMAGIHRERRDIFVDCLSDYERLRGYVARRHGDVDADPRTVSRWMADNGGGLLVEGVPEADAWRERYWPDPTETEAPDGAND